MSAKDVAGIIIPYISPMWYPNKCDVLSTLRGMHDAGCVSIDDEL